MSAEELRRIADQVASCTKCPLADGRTHAVPGEGPPGAAVFVVGEAPGRKEDEAGRPFVGSAGRNLERLLGEAGLERSGVFLTNVVKCRPPANRRPRSREADACRPYLRRQMSAVAPAVVLLLGDTALKQFFPGSALGDVHGRAMRRGGTVYFPTYHPASMMYNRSLEQVLRDDLAGLGAHLRASGPEPQV